jgi:hypothetical protein
MALDATLSASTQNSYVTVDEAELYFEDRPYSTKWDTYSEADKPKLLIYSSNLIDWYIKWKGYKADSDQPMEWPRSDVILRDGTELDDDVLPVAVKKAVYELALSTLEKGKDRTLDDDLLGLEQLKVASLSLRAKPDKWGKRTSATEVIPEKVYEILRDLRSSSAFGSVRLIRG